MTQGHHRPNKASFVLTPIDHALSISSLLLVYVQKVVVARVVDGHRKRLRALQWVQHATVAEVGCVAAITDFFLEAEEDVCDGVGEADAVELIDHRLGEGEVKEGKKGEGEKGGRVCW